MKQSLITVLAITPPTPAPVPCIAQAIAWILKSVENIAITATMKKIVDKKYCSKNMIYALLPD